MNHKTIYLLITGLTILFVSVIACDPGGQNEGDETAKVNFAAATLHPDAPSETRQLGQLVGIWNAEQTIRSRDGQWSGKRVKAIWKWFYILDGHAIQDDWIVVDSTGQRNVVGTNIRIYNPEEKQWHMAWIDKTNRRLATFTAVFEEGNIIMTGHNAKGRMIRNTFHDLTEQSFNWTQQWTNDDGKTWFAVTKIHCERQQ